jgi:hypothetical protein
MSFTPIRSIRISQQIWDAVKAKAAAQNDTVSHIVVKLLTDWLKS